MAIRQGNTEPIEIVRDRLCRLFPDDVSEVTRQIHLVIACAEHLGVAVTPSMIENLVTEHLRARAHSRTTPRPAVRRTQPAVPLICRGPDPAG
jgi:hypothetical protein